MDGTTNSGLPWIIGHWKPGLDERDPEKLEAFRWLVKERVPAVNEELSRGEIVKFAAVASTRMTQKGEGGPSMRLVDALDKAEPIMWKRFTPELLSKLRECGQFVALDDIPFIDLTMQSILDKASESGRTILSGDYSHYDQSLPSGLIELAGTIIANWVRGGRTFVNALVSSMVTSAMVSPSGIVPWRRGGMRSGSGGTNLLDSICNLIVIMYGEEAGFWKVEQAAVQGDDFILDGEGVSPEAIAEVSTLFGLTAHPDKQYFASDSLMFLQRLHIRGKLGGIASTTRTLGSILSYERLVLRPNKWDSEVADTIRARAQLQNAWANPFFEILVKFVSKGDRFKLGGSATMRELLKRAGDSAEAIIRSSLSGQAEIQGGRIDTSSLDAAVIGVLSGKRIPEWGTKSRFEWAYGDRATAARAIEQRKM
nr:putative replicase [Sotsystermes virus]